MANKNYVMTPKKINNVKSMIKDFLVQKGRLDNKIRSYDVNESDFFKEFFLECYLSGMLIMIRGLNLKYNIDDKQISFDIEFADIEKELDDPQKVIQFAFNFLKKKIIDNINKIDNEDYSSHLNEYEKEIHRVLYILLGSLTVMNKFGFKIYFDILNKYFGDNTTVDREPVLQQIYADEEEVDDYIELSKKINELTDIIYKKINLEKSFQILSWKNSINSRFNAVNIEILSAVDRIENIKNFNQIQERTKQYKKQSSDTLEILTTLQEDLILTETKHKAIVQELVAKYFNIIKEN